MESLMATKSIAQAQLAELPERVGILETRVENIQEKVADVKADIKEMHDCLDNTRDLVVEKLEAQNVEYRANSKKFFDHADKLHAEDAASHKKLADKVSELEKLKSKWTTYFMVACAFAAGSGWIHATNIKELIKVIGL